MMKGKTMHDNRVASINRQTVDVVPFIDGKSVHSASKETIEVFNPATGKRSMTIPAGCDTDVDRAVASARGAFDDGRWSELPPSQKKGILSKFADLIEQEAGQLDILDAIDMGKPVGLPGFNASDFIRFCANAIDKVLGDVYTSDTTTFVAQHRVPRGVVGAVTPWNFPTVNAVMKLAPALATGNCVVLKPSECSSQSAMRLAHLAIEAGLPPGTFNVVPGRGEIVGRALALHRDVDMITFTGSTSVGKQMLQYAGQSNMKLVHAECGGKSPHIVFADFTDLDAVADGVAQSILHNQGQICVAGSRLLVQAAIEKPLVEKVTERMQQIVAGDPLDPKTTFGPLVNRRQMERVLDYISSGKQSGATLVTGGRRMREESGGFFVEPTLFSNVAPDAKIAQEEIFGPVLSVISFNSIDEAIQLANSTAYGLAAYVWTTDLATGMKVSKQIRAGTVCVRAVKPSGEGPGIAFSQEPVGQSGVGVENGMAGMEAYLRRQVVWFDHG